MSKDRVAAHRQRMRERGYKEVRFWVPDVSSPEFIARIRREAGALNAADRRDDAAEFLADIQADVLAAE